MEGGRGIPDYAQNVIASIDPFLPKDYKEATITVSDDNDKSSNRISVSVHVETSNESGDLTKFVMKSAPSLLKKIKLKKLVSAYTQIADATRKIKRGAGPAFAWAEMILILDPSGHFKMNFKYDD